MRQDFFLDRVKVGKKDHGKSAPIIDWSSFVFGIDPVISVNDRPVFTGPEAYTRALGNSLQQPAIDSFIVGANKRVQKADGTQEIYVNSVVATIASNVLAAVLIC